jgi:hypothetical protein
MQHLTKIVFPKLVYVSKYLLIICTSNGTYLHFGHLKQSSSIDSIISTIQSWAVIVVVLYQPGTLPSLAIGMQGYLCLATDWIWFVAAIQVCKNSMKTPHALYWSLVHTTSAGRLQKSLSKARPC